MRYLAPTLVLCVAATLSAQATPTPDSTARGTDDKLTLDKLLDWENVGILRL